MKFRFKDKLEVQKARARFEYLVKKESDIDLTEIRDKRTLNQNSYIHVLFGLWGIYYGVNLEDSKLHLKRACHFMRKEIKGEEFYLRTRDLNTKQMTDFIDWIRNYCSDNGCYLPTPQEFIENKFYFDREIESNKEYL